MVRKDLYPGEGPTWNLHPTETHRPKTGKGAFPIGKGPAQDARKGRLPSILVSLPLGPNTGYPESLLHATHLSTGTVRLEEHCLLVAAPEGTVSHSAYHTFPPASSTLPGEDQPLSLPNTGARSLLARVVLGPRQRGVLGHVSDDLG